MRSDLEAPAPEDVIKPGGGKGAQKRVFLGYAGEDRLFVDLLKNKLEPFVGSVWVDWEIVRPLEDNLASNPAYMDRIQRELQDAALIIFVVSEKWVGKKFPMLELGWALNLPDRGTRVLPVLLDWSLEQAKERSAGTDYAHLLNELFTLTTLNTDGSDRSYDKLTTLVAGTVVEDKLTTLVAGTVVERQGIAPQTAPPTWVERKADVHAITAALGIPILGEPRGLDQEGCVVAVEGMSGVGKSALLEHLYDLAVPKYVAAGRKVVLVKVGHDADKAKIEAVQEQILRGLGIRFNDGDNLKPKLQQALGMEGYALFLDDIWQHAADTGHLEDLFGRDWDYLLSKGLGKGSFVVLAGQALPKRPWWYKHHLEVLDADSAKELFRKHAFRNNDDGRDLPWEEVVEACAGLPYALTVFGSMLQGKADSGWENVLAQLRELSDAGVGDRLKVLYSLLESKHQEAFVDIAMHWHDKECEVVEAALGPGVLAELLRRSLVDKARGEVYTSGAVLKVNVVGMHALLKRVGVAEAKEDKSWIVDPTPEEVEQYAPRGVAFTKDAKADNFQKGLLKLRVLNVEHDFSGKINLRGCEELRWLKWPGYPHTSIDLNRAASMVWMDLHNGALSSTKFLSALTNLRHLNLSGCTSLTSLRELSALTNLKGLDLSGCTGLTSLPELSVLTNLKGLDLSGCTSLTSLPELPTNLRHLDLRGCTSLTSLPELLPSVYIPIPSDCSNAVKEAYTKHQNDKLYNKALEEGEGNVKRCRVVLLGQERVGKSSLWRALCKERFNPCSESTEVMDFKRAQALVDGSFQPVEAKEINVRGPIWDFMKGLRTKEKPGRPVPHPDPPSEGPESPSLVPPALGGTSTTIAAGGGGDIEGPRPVPGVPGVNVSKVEPPDEPESRPSTETDLVYGRMPGDLASGRDGLVLTGWDFAGQRIYYALHQVFIPAGGIFILTFNLAEVAHPYESVYNKAIENIAFWLNSIYWHLTRDPEKESHGTVFLVGTHKDCLTDPPRDVKLVRYRLRDALSGNPAYAALVCSRPGANVYAVSCKRFERDPVLTELRKDMQKAAEKFVEKKHPLRYLGALDRLQKGQIGVLRDEEALKVMEPFVKGNDDLRASLAFMDTLGEIFYFEKANLIVDPTWIADMFRPIMLRPDKNEERRYLQATHQSTGQSCIPCLTIQSKGRCCVPAKGWCRRTDAFDAELLVPSHFAAPSGMHQKEWSLLWEQLERRGILDRRLLEHCLWKRRMWYPAKITVVHGNGEYSVTYERSALGKADRRGEDIRRRASDKTSDQKNTRWPQCWYTGHCSNGAETFKKDDIVEARPDLVDKDDMEVALKVLEELHLLHRLDDGCFFVPFVPLYATPRRLPKPETQRLCVIETEQPPVGLLPLVLTEGIKRKLWKLYSVSSPNYLGLDVCLDVNLKEACHYIGPPWNGPTWREMNTRPQSGWARLTIRVQHTVCKLELLHHKQSSMADRSFIMGQTVFNVVKDLWEQRFKSKQNTVGCPQLLLYPNEEQDLALELHHVQQVYWNHAPLDSHIAVDCKQFHMWLTDAEKPETSQGGISKGPKNRSEDQTTSRFLEEAVALLQAQLRVSAGERKCPRYVIFLPCKLGCNLSLLNPTKLFKMEFDVYFFCPVCGEEANKGEPFKLSMRRQSLQKFAPALRVGLGLLDFICRYGPAIVGRLAGIPLPPLPSFMLRVDAKVEKLWNKIRHDLKSDIRAKVRDLKESSEFQSLVKRGEEKERKVLQSAVDSRITEIVGPAYNLLHVLLTSKDPTLAYTGLAQTTGGGRKADVEWICSKQRCRRAFQDKGKEAFIIQTEGDII